MKYKEHPEVRKGEIFIRYIRGDNFRYFIYKTKRLGNAAYPDVVEGNMYYPLFVMEEEYEEVSKRYAKW